MHEALGDLAPKVIEALGAEESVTAVRANPAKIDVDSLKTRFPEAGDMVPWCADAFYLERRPLFALDALFHAGAYYVQDPSAMFVGSVAGSLISSSEASLKVLDLCAAPGGKSTSLASALRGGDLLVSNEVIGTRATILAENMVKWGSHNTIVTNNDPKDFEKFNGCFDIILADVPCSGEGMFRKDAGAIAEWSPENVKLCAARQRRILADVWPALKEGGYLIYSTCTFNRQENDGNVEWICRELGAEVVPPLPVPNAFCRIRKKTVGGLNHSSRQAEGETANEVDCVADNGALETQYGLQFGPGLTRGEGQYVAVLRKMSSARPASFRSSKPLRKAECDWLRDGFDCFSVETSSGTLVKGYPQALVQDIRTIEERLRVLRSGVAVAAVKGRDLVPQADLALSQAFCREAFASIELTKEEALQFLRCEVLHLPEAPKGFVSVTCEHLPLGFVKNLGSRANNLFPQAWRLRL